jgi:hypothetical protein
MHPVAGRLDVVKQLAFLLEGSLRGCEVAVFEQRLGADAVEQPGAHIEVRSADVIDAEAPLGVGMAQREDAGRCARHRGIYGIETEAVGS